MADRLTDGYYRYGGRECQAALDEPSRHDAIHGIVRWLEWSTLAQAAASVSLGCALHPQPGYEWNLDLRITYALAEDGLTVALEASNGANEAAPFGAGFHPYLTLGAATSSTTSCSAMRRSTTLDSSAAPGDPVRSPWKGLNQDFQAAPRPSGRWRTRHMLRRPPARPERHGDCPKFETPAAEGRVERWADHAFR